MPTLAEDVVDTVREPLVILHADLRVRFANRAFYSAFHVTAEETLEQGFFEMHGRQWEDARLRELLEQVAQGELPLEGWEFSGEFATVGRRTMLLNARRIVSHADGRMILVAMEDVTDRRAAEAAARDAAEELARSNAELERFAYAASHDLQEPLRMVASYTQLLQKKYAGRLDARADRYIEYAVDGARRMQELINGLLVYSRVRREAGRCAAVDAERALSAALANLETAREESGARVTHDPLPAVRVNAGQLVALFQNLLSNAFKFRGAAAPQVHVSAIPEGTQWRFAVADNGIGIEAQYFERIFIVFQRLNSRSEYPGTGIGLALCRKIVEQHGGRLTVESTPGRGSTFYFTLPGVEEEEHAARTDG